MNDIVKPDENLPLPAKRGWKILKIPAALVSCTVDSVKRLPDLKEPVFDPYYLPERSGAIAAVLYSWSYNFRKFEYAIDPFGKGFRGWVRLFLGIVFFIGVPIAAMVGLCSGAAYVLACASNVVEQALALTWRVFLLLLSIIGVGLLGYLTYFVVKTLRDKRKSELDGEL